MFVYKIPYLGQSMILGNTLKALIIFTFHKDRIVVLNNKIYDEIIKKTFPKIKKAVVNEPFDIFKYYNDESQKLYGVPIFDLIELLIVKNIKKADNTTMEKVVKLKINVLLEKTEGLLSKFSGIVGGIAKLFIGAALLLVMLSVSMISIGAMNSMSK